MGPFQLSCLSSLRSTSIPSSSVLVSGPCAHSIAAPSVCLSCLTTGLHEGRPQIAPNLSVVRNIDVTGPSLWALITPYSLRRGDVIYGTGGRLLYAHTTLKGPSRRARAGSSWMDKVRGAGGVEGCMLVCVSFPFGLSIYEVRKTFTFFYPPSLPLVRIWC